MLRFHHRWRDAFEQAPLRETRELWFAHTPTNPIDPRNNPNRPPEATEAARGAGQQRAADDVQQEREQTREAVDAVAPDEHDGAEHAEHAPSIAEVLKKYTEAQAAARQIRDLLNRKAVRDAIKKLSAEEQEQFHREIHELDLQHEFIARNHASTQVLADWQSNQLSPAQFREFLERYYAEHDDRAEILAQFDAYVATSEHADAIARWNQGALEQESEKAVIVRELGAIARTDAMLLELTEYGNMWYERATVLRKGLEEEVKKAAEKHGTKEHEEHGEQSVLGKFKKFLDGIGLEFHSPLAWWEAFKQVKQAWEEAKQEKLRQQGARIALGMGKTLSALHMPYGREVNLRLESNAESQDNKAKNEYKETFEDDSFSTLEEKLKDVFGDRPKTMAILEVAAGHGWIYEIDDKRYEDPMQVTLFGYAFRDLVSNHWDEKRIKNYYGTLTKQNERGKDEEKDKLYNSIKKEDDPEKFKIELKKQLNGHNYWGAMGVAKAFLDRGKEGHTDAYVMLELLQHLRDDPIAQRYISGKVLEQYGILDRWATVTWVHNMMVMEKDKLLGLKKDPTRMEGLLLGTIKKIETRIRQLSGKDFTGDQGRRELTEMTAKVMVGDSVEVAPGRYISIYDPEFVDYRSESTNGVFGLFGPESVSKSIQDFFKMDSAMLVAPKKFVELMFEAKSQGTPEHEEEAVNYVGFALKRLKQLRDPGRGHSSAEAETFRKETGEKLLEGMLKLLTPAGAGEAPKLKWKRAHEEGGPLVASVVKAGFFSLDELRNALRAAGRDVTSGTYGQFFTAVERQMRQLDDNFKSRGGHGGTAPAGHGAATPTPRTNPRGTPGAGGRAPRANPARP